ncbi:hypothetical protein AOLI_G00093680 [Acnodon oligacanthus]
MWDAETRLCIPANIQTCTTTPDTPDKPGQPGPAVCLRLGQKRSLVGSQGWPRAVFPAVQVKRDRRKVRGDGAAAESSSAALTLPFSPGG